MRIRLPSGLLLLCSLIAFLAGGIASQASLPFFGAKPTEETSKTTDKLPAFMQPGEPLLPLRNGMPSYAQIVDIAAPAVVSVYVFGKKTVNQPDIFQYFFGDRAPVVPQEQPFQVSGSGVIIDAKKGYIVTNAHVVEGADKIQIKLDDKNEFEAKKIGEDKQTDIALLQIEPDPKQPLTQIKIADSDQLARGDNVLAIGNPFGQEQSVTKGIVSALRRNGLSLENFENFIQTDAAINPGNSGGALVNLRGELIGINTAILGQNGNIGIGFAIPSNMVQSLTQQLIKFGEVRRGLLGIIGSELTPELAKTFNYNRQYGAFVNQVSPGSAADKAGFKPGDIITALDSKEITSFGELRARVATMGAGKQVKIEVFRDGKPLVLEVTLDHAQSKQMVSDGSLHPALAGATLTDTPKDAPIQGVRVSSVKSQSPAAAFGLEEDDVILEVNRKPVANVEQLQEILEKTKSKGLALRVQRGNLTLYLTIR